MKFNLFYFPGLGSGSPTSHERKMIGNDPAQFEYLLEDLRLHAQLAEDAGFHGVYFAEHHFDTEGFESCPNPLMLDNWVGRHTNRIHIGAMGLALPCWHPLRAAEDIAVMTHMWGDRFEVGFVRGAFGREVAPLAAAHQVTSGVSDRSESDQRNRRLFEENYRILMDALTKDVFSYSGEFHTLPPPGLQWVNLATEKYGEGVVDADGNVTNLGVVPKPKGRKLPVRWQCFSHSEETMRFAGREGMNLALIAHRPSDQRRFQETFQEESALAGRDLAYGEGVCYVRGMLCNDDGDKARAADEAASMKVWGEKFFSGSPITFLEPEDDPATLKFSYDLLLDRDFLWSGTPDDISRSLEKLAENTNCEHLALLINTGSIPRDMILRSLELFAEKVMPRFDIEPTPALS
jgi:alkanesulfonate monooxygenase SsuD/methylene tetrahydromethanopterin reductase-like flavin-dependent oxidoreductase (luciferase family)